jgi:hypothetical protein
MHQHNKNRRRSTHLFHFQHAEDLRCDAGCQALKKATVAAQLLNCSDILISHLRTP